MSPRAMRGATAWRPAIDGATARDSALPAWRAAGIDEFDEMAVLTLEASGVAPQPAVRDTPSLVLRALSLADELELAVEAQVAARDLAR